MSGEMEKNQLIRDLFGDLSDEEVGSTDHKLAFASDEGQKTDHDGETKSDGEEEVDSGLKQMGVDCCHVRGPRLGGDTKGIDRSAFSAGVIHDIFGDHDDFDDDDEDDDYDDDDDDDDDESGEYPINNIQKKNANLLKIKLKGKEVSPHLHPPSADLDQMAVFQLSNLIGIDPNPFDPSTFIEEDFYADDAYESIRFIPPANIIRWREVRNPDGTASVETNARFVSWSDGSLQLLIGNESFDVSYQDAKAIQDHIFGRHEKVETEIRRSNEQLSENKTKVNKKYAANGPEEHQPSSGSLEECVDESYPVVELFKLDLAEEGIGDWHLMTTRMGCKDHPQSSSRSKQIAEETDEVKNMDPCEDSNFEYEVSNNSGT